MKYKKVTFCFYKVLMIWPKKIDFFFLKQKSHKDTNVLYALFQTCMLWCKLHDGSVV